MKYILDTDTLIYFLKGKRAVVEKMSVIEGADLSTTIINKTELLYGAFNSEQKEQNLEKVHAFLGEIKILDFPHAASFLFAEHKAYLKKQGNLLADMDLMIASIVLSHDGILVTNNVRHFQKIKKLKIENWAG